MRYVWLAVIALSAAPLVYVAWLLNPLLLIAFGADWWYERMAQLRPYRWQICCLGLICVGSIAVYVSAYG